ncbi:MAG: threonine-phosphate decarboxylase CobD [Enterobacteriaceae bacterium]|nr:threonine-phosphate decarboxylase CobD [Enterobacteriaceae bacterium]
MSQHGGNTVEVAQQLGIPADTLIDFSANINPLGAPERVKTLIKDNLACIEKYPDVEYRHLHQKLAAAHHCDPASIIAGNGATELIYSIVRYLKPRKALLLTPGFAEYRRALQQQQSPVEIIDYPLSEKQGFQPDWCLLETLSEVQPDCLFIATPNNPTGLMPDTQFLRALVDYCELHRIALIVDEAFIDFIPNAEGLIQQINSTRHLYILRSLTKFFAIPGLRLGYLISGDTTGIAWLKAHREPWSINAFAALAGEVLLDDQQYIADTHRWLKIQQHYLWTHLSAFSELTVWKPTVNYLFFRCNKSDFDLQSALLEHHILIRHCKNYSGLNASYYRAAVRSEQENRLLIDALEKIFPHG